MSFSQPLPDHQVVLVEYPGYVRNAEAALDTLGGVDAITAAVSSDSRVLQLRFRPDDPYSHPLYAERQPTEGLLIKLVRDSVTSSESGVTAEVVACVHTKFTFAGMADYQYLPNDLSVDGQGSCTSTGPYGEEKLPMLCVPPLFTKNDVPLDYAFKNFRASDRPASSKAKQPPWVIPVTAAAVPQPATSQGGAEEDELAKIVQSHFSSRPIWTQASLAHQMPSAAQPDLEPHLQRLCYQFKEGPWRGAWIQRGHDPRQDAASLQYQTLQYDLPQAWYERTAAQQPTTNGQPQLGITAPIADTAGPSLDELHRFEALPISQSTVFQLCDLRHPDLQQLLQTSSPAAECNDKSGWLTQASWDQVLSKVQELFGKHMG